MLVIGLYFLKTNVNHNIVSLKLFSFFIGCNNLYFIPLKNEIGTSIETQNKHIKRKKIISSYIY